LIGILFLLTFVVLGNLLSRKVLAPHHLLVRIWAGTLLGTVGIIWCVVPFALLWGFNSLSHLVALLFMGAITWLICRLVPLRSSSSPEEHFSIPIYLTIAGISGILMVLFFLQILYPKNGGLLAGSSTFADLPFHLNIITNIVEQRRLSGHQFGLSFSDQLSFRFLEPARPVTAVGHPLARLLAVLCGHSRFHHPGEGNAAKKPGRHSRGSPVFL
jgi:hypothetical protein